MSFGSLIFCSFILLGLACLILVGLKRDAVRKRLHKWILLPYAIIGLVLMWPIWTGPFPIRLWGNSWESLTRDFRNLFVPVPAILYGIAIYYQNKLADFLLHSGDQFDWRGGSPGGATLVIGIIYLCAVFLLFCKAVVLVSHPYYSSDYGEGFILFLPYGLVVSTVMAIANASE